jgi:hypothetical protein
VLRAIAGSPDEGWLTSTARSAVSGAAGRSTGTELVLVRRRPEPLLAFVGALDEADHFRLEALRSLLVELPSRLRFLDWVTVQQAVDRLAEALALELGADALGRARLVGVPRGGLIVTGLLAVRLGLGPESLGPPEVSRPLVVVDDCALSGSRLRGFLYAQDHPGPLVAVLASHPGLRRALAAAVPEVRAVVSAVDLHDHAPERQGSDYPRWRARWRTRHQEDVWTGDPDLVAFPWSEPETSVFNPVTGHSEPGWRVLPDTACLKNRPPPGGDGQTPVIAALEEAPGYLRPPARVLAGRHGAAVVVVGADGSCVRLRDTAADFWEVVTAVPSEQTAVEVLCDRYGAPAEAVRNDLVQFTTALRERALLVPAPI